MQPSHSLTAAAAAGSSAAAAMAAAAGSSAAADVTMLGPNAFADLVEADVAPDQLFFHKFFNLSAVKSKSQTAAAARAAKAAAAAAKAAAGDGSGSDEDDGDLDGGELGTQGIESDEDLESEEVDKALAEAEGVEDDGLGDPDVGYDYDSLLAAMAADGSGSEGGSSQEGEEAASGSGSDGGSSDGGSGSGSGDDGGSSSGEEEEGESEEGEWVMFEGAAAAAAAVDGSSKAGKGEQKKKRKLDAGRQGTFCLFAGACWLLWLVADSSCCDVLCGAGPAREDC